MPNHEYNIIFFIILKVCDRGTYGAGCNETCGYCSNKDTCIHTNGTCVKGCDTGYNGDYCKTRK